MQISALTDIVEGKLLNSPAISFITQIHTNVKKVNEGDAFFALNSKDLQTAINNGAFAVICQFEPEITDNEIAWIYVDNIYKAVTNTLRYKLIKSKCNFIKIDKVLYNLISHFKTKNNDNMILISDNIIDDFETLYTIDTEKTIYSNNTTILKKISPDIQTIEYQPHNIKNLTCHSLFETSFSYHNRFFDKIKLPSVYIDHFIQLMKLFNYELDIKKLNSFDMFKPLFINKSNQIVPFGQTNRFILSNIDNIISDIEINYLYIFYKYGQIKVIDAKVLSEKEIFEYIKLSDYNALYFKNITIEQIAIILEQNYKEHNLF